MSARIMRLYTRRGVPKPEGKGEHTYAFHNQATAMMAKGVPRSEAYATAMKHLGRDKAVKRSHWDPSYRKKRRRKRST